MRRWVNVSPSRLFRVDIINISGPKKKPNRYLTEINFIFLNTYINNIGARVCVLHDIIIVARVMTVYISTRTNILSCLTDGNYIDFPPSHSYIYI